MRPGNASERWALFPPGDEASQGRSPPAEDGAEPAGLDAMLAGLPLDVVKIVAAAAMTIDHYNDVLLGRSSTLAFAIGRLAFPLFCFALVLHLKRGAAKTSYVSRLLLVGAGSQLPFAAAFKMMEANTLITFAIAVVIAAWLRERGAFVQHGVFAAGIAAILTPGVPEQIGTDYDIAGILFPGALLLALTGQRAHIFWAALLFIGFNFYRESPLAEVAVTAAGTLLGCAGVIGGAALFRGRPRVMPRYALYAFYPAHLLALLLARALTGM